MTVLEQAGPGHFQPGSAGITAPSPQNQGDYLDAVSFQQVLSKDAFALVIGISVV